MSQKPLLIEGRLQRSSAKQQVFNLFSKELIGEVSYLGKDDLTPCFKFAQLKSLTASYSPIEVVDFLKRLAHRIEQQKKEFVEVLCDEIGFTLQDSYGLVNQGIDFLNEYEYLWNEQKLNPKFYTLGNANDHCVTSVETVPYGTIVIILPANACFQIALIAIANGLAGGNQIIIRSASQTTLTMAMLAEVIVDAGNPGDAIQIINCESRGFLSEALRARVDLVHFFGSSKFYDQIAAQCAEAGVNLIYEGQGNTTAIVLDDVNGSSWMQLCGKGAIRFNGETCTSINGVLIHKDKYQEALSSLESLFSKYTTGDPKNPTIEIGPLLSPNQINQLYSLVEKANARIVTGKRLSENLMSPMLITNVTLETQLVCEGFFAPALWVAYYGCKEEIFQFLQRNIYPICHVIFSPGMENAQRRFISLPNIAKLVINDDPSKEIYAEPWGAYGNSGNGKVSTWLEKYSRTIQIVKTETGWGNSPTPGVNRSAT